MNTQRGILAAKFSSDYRRRYMNYITFAVLSPNYTIPALRKIEMHLFLRLLWRRPLPNHIILSILNLKNRDQDMYERLVEYTAEHFAGTIVRLGPDLEAVPEVFLNDVQRQLPRMEVRIPLPSQRE
ncbi:hypothetical protein KEM56_007227 [Ascosphaera pollenicola]|nr:hypothetical protein KEM56_007227 [Ascosphaera pollenicola]